MDVGLYHRGVDAQSFAVLQTQCNGGLNHPLVDSLQSLRRDPAKGPIEGIVLGNRMTVELRKTAQGQAIVNALAQFAVVPVLDAHENQRAQNLRRRHALAPGAGVFQAALQILTDFLDHALLLLEDGGDGSEGGVELDAQALPLEVGEADLLMQDSAHESSTRDAAVGG